MTSISADRSRFTVGAIAAALVIGAAVPLLVVAPMAVAAAAGPGPIIQPATNNVTADALPTVQIDGVVWSQAIAGGIVYAGGKFANARPAGSPVGTNNVARGNMLAYTLSTGVLVPSFAPIFNSDVKAVAASPDGKRIYAAGSFTTLNGAVRNRIAAFNTATGALITTFAAGVDASVNAIVATNTTVYVGGLFANANGSARNHLAAFQASNGALTTWAPNADAKVNALTFTPDGTKVIAGGAFQHVNGAAWYGMAALDATSGALLPWAAVNLVKDAGVNSAITSLKADTNAVYGTGYVFGAGGNFEGTFSADPATGNIKWLEDCHGDTYDSFPVNGIVYTVSHAHFCANDGGWPVYNPWQFRHSVAFTASPTGVLLPNSQAGYANFGGQPSPSIINWFPDFVNGTYTGQNQAAWTVTGTSQYVVEGGEFPSVNGVGQQGLVRFAVRPIAAAKSGPRVTGAHFVPHLKALSSSAVRIAFQSNWDRDDKTLTYKIVRNSDLAHPIWTANADSQWWNLPTIGYTNTGLTPNTSYRYRLYVNDADGNTVAGDTVVITTPASGTQPPYDQQVIADGASSYWPLGEASGTTFLDNAGFNDVDASTGVTRGAAGPVAGATATTFSGSSTGTSATRTETLAPNTFTLGAWVRTTTTRGGKILGFGNAKTGGSTTYDRHLYLANNGQVFFGVNSGAIPTPTNSASTVNSPAAINDGQWHQVVGTLGPAGMALYVDGVRVGQRTDVTAARTASGWWRIGGDNLAGWPSVPTSNYLSGTIADVAVFPTVLSRQTIDNEYTMSGRTLNIPAAPTDAYGSAVYTDDPDIYWRLDDASGPTAADVSANKSNGTYTGGETFQVASPVSGASGKSVTFNGVNGTIGSQVQYNNPSVYSEEAWFKTTSTSGGKIIGFGNLRTGASTTFDRHVYMLNGGQLVFGTYTGVPNLAQSPASYNDGQWHHVVATQGSDGMKLYVDGQVVATNAQTGAQNYAGFWRVGGDSSWAGSGPYFAGTIDEAAVYSAELTPARVLAHYKASPVATNAAPVARFTSSATGATVSLNASGSSDSDGTIASYAWDFGDGSSGSGVAASHTYASSGTFQVRLTVTDNQGTSGTVTSPVTVTTPPPNQPPTAAFTSSVANLAVGFDGSGSSDSDGTVASYAWDFGDGSTGIGVSPSHTYATAAAFTVKLTVTDNQGSTGSVSHVVTTTAPATAADAFERTVVNGWGTADSGGAWSLMGSSALFSVNGGTAKIKMATATSGPSAFLNGYSARDVSGTVDISFDSVPTGGGTYAILAVRHSGNSDYRLKVKVLATSATLYLTKLVAGTETTIVSKSVALSYAPGDVYRLKFQASGSGTTALMGKVWKVGATEPVAWTVTGSDTEATLQSTGGVGLASYLSGTSTTIPVVESFDNLSVGPVGP